MYPNPRFGHWRNQRLKNSAESSWKIREFLAPVTTRSRRTISGPVQPRFKRKREEDSPSDTNKDTTAMTALHEEDPEIGSLNVHLNGEPSSAIVVSTG
ncbi:linoleate 13S-lipoxygenase 2-1, chloroplastic-like [Salvia divinorum]|uniref:Linoleate 13S-lipoxygenase 2-1, chloroplastic-like n=1 Tax=Salvia divinorum TaxID=28513 RepID=A0ABD1HY40_SALDI